MNKCKWPINQFIVLALIGTIFNQSHCCLEPCVFSSTQQFFLFVFRFALKREMKSSAFNTGRCSHFIPCLPGWQSGVPMEVPFLPLHPHLASAYFDKGQSCSIALSSMHGAAALRLEINEAHSERSEGCTEHGLQNAAGDERSCLLLGFSPLLLS